MSASLDDASVRTSRPQDPPPGAWRFVGPPGRKSSPSSGSSRSSKIIVVPVLLLALMISAFAACRPWIGSTPAVCPAGGAVGRWSCWAEFAILGGILAFVISQFIVGLPDLVKQVERSIDSSPQMADRRAGRI